MALTADRNVDRYVDQELRTYRVKGTTTVYKGALVGLAAGYARGLAAGDKFLGLAYESIDNSAGDDGDKSVRVYTVGDFDHAVSGAAQTDVGRPVFASADGTLTFTAESNSYVGIVQDFLAGGQVIVRIDPARRLVKTITHAVENLAANAARAIHCFEHEGWITAARIVNQATAATGIDNSNTCVIGVAINAGAVAGKTYNASVTFPAANTRGSLGTLTNTHAAAGDVLTLAVTNGTTADPGPFLVEADYV